MCSEWRDNDKQAPGTVELGRGLRLTGRVSSWPHGTRAHGVPVIIRVLCAQWRDNDKQALGTVELGRGLRLTGRMSYQRNMAALLHIVDVCRLRLREAV